MGEGEGLVSARPSTRSRPRPNVSNDSFDARIESCESVKVAVENRLSATKAQSPLRNETRVLKARHCCHVLSGCLLYGKSTYTLEEHGIRKIGTEVSSEKIRIFREKVWKFEVFVMSSREWPCGYAIY